MRLLSPAEAWKTLTPSDFMKPERLMGDPRWNFLEIVKLTWPEVDFNSKTGNTARHGDHPIGDVMTLKNSFATGVDARMEIPCVRRKKGPSGWIYKLQYGFGRCEALEELKTIGWFFVVVEGDDAGIEWLKLKENEKYPKSTSRELDIASSVNNMIKLGTVENTEPSLKKKLKEELSGRAVESRNRIVQIIMNFAKTPKNYVFYTESKAKRWVNEQASYPYVLSGKFDPNSDMYGYSAKQGGLDRTVSSAARNYIKHGKKSYVLMHVGEPTENSSIGQKRDNCAKEFDTIMKMWKDMGVDEPEFLVFEGCLPQIIGDDDFSEIIPRKRKIRKK